MRDQNENNIKSVSVEDKYDKTDNSLNNSDNNNQNENSIDPSQEVKVSTDDKISSSNVVYTKSCTMNKKKKLIIGSIVGGIILIGVIILIIILTRNKPCTGPECDPIPPTPNDTSIWVDYNISSKIFKTTLTEETKTKFNFKRNGRRLDDESKTKTINNEILFDIYEINNDLINAYVLLLSREEIEDGKTKSSNDKVNDAAKVSFTKNGEIKELSFSTTSNEIIKNELRDIIEGIIPNLKNKTQSDSTKFNVSYEVQKGIAIDEDALVGSNVNLNLITNVDENYVKDFTFTKEFSLKNSEYDNDLIYDSDSINPKDAFKNDLETVNILIDSMEVTYNMKTTFDKKLEDKKVEEYQNKLKKWNFQVKLLQRD